MLTLFGAGVFTSLTPCLYPMIPITAGIIAATADHEKSRWRTVLLTLTYVLGLALLYAGWGAYWSWCGCRLYLRLERPGRVVAALTVIVVLAAVTAQLWVWVSVTKPT